MREFTERALSEWRAKQKKTATENKKLPGSPRSSVRQAQPWPHLDVFWRPIFQHPQKDRVQLASKCGRECSSTSSRQALPTALTMPRHPVDVTIFLDGCGAFEPRASAEGGGGGGRIS